MTHFVIDRPALTAAALDRSEDLRDPRRLLDTWSHARVLQLGPGGTLPLVDGTADPQLALVAARHWGERPPPGAILLGSIDGTDYWCVARHLGAPLRIPSGSGGEGESATLRAIGSLLGQTDAALATTAVALDRWHAEAVFCSRCGRATAPDIAGHSRLCPVGHQEFPRTDAAVIVLLHDGADRLVLARQPSWPVGRFSMLAGFAEAGESLESAVAREMYEEVGLDITDITYVGSQPWPFPRSLMVAFAARAAPDSVPHPRAAEIAEARWFSRAELVRLLAGPDTPRSGADGRQVDGSGQRGLSLPSSVSIARRMIEAFVAAG